MKKLAVLSLVMFVCVTVSACSTVHPGPVSESIVGDNTTDAKGMPRDVMINQSRYSDQELVQILKNAGYTSVVNEDDGKIVITIDGSRYILFNLHNGDLQLYYYISGVSVSPKRINEWNRTKRLSRAYFDRDNDPVIEADLMANDGLTPENITSFMQVFKYSTERFSHFVSGY